MRDHGRPPSRGLLVLLLLACLTVITLDVHGGAHSPIAPLRTAVGAVVGPVEDATATALRPFRAVPEFFHTTSGLRDELTRLRAQNAALRARLSTGPYAGNRVAELQGLLRTSRDTGYALVPAQVIAMGPAQSFGRTVTIDAGTSSGVFPDMTVVDNDGLVGRVVRADRSTATVLLIIDRESVVGGRLGSSMELGFLHGSGDVDGSGRLNLQLVDRSVTPSRGDVVVSWGSENGRPYVAGIPIGRVDSVYSSPREQSTEAVITPFADFSSLDLVGVVVNPGTHSDRPLIDAGRIDSASGAVQGGGH
jgi:rod shape-determining protein MreC